MDAVVVLAHAASTWFLTGLIWLVQVVHYPLFAGVGADGFVTYQGQHATRITRVLALPWAVQGVTTAVLLVAPPAAAPRWLVWLAAALAVVPVAVTVTASVPAHQRLGDGFDVVVHRRLVRTNWARTLAWSAHAVVATILVARVLG